VIGKYWWNYRRLRFVTLQFVSRIRFSSTNASSN